MMQPNQPNLPSPNRLDVIQTPSTAELLSAWEQGRDQPTAWQAVVLLSVACPGVSLATLAQLTIGHRDALLLALRERVFGAALNGLARCPACSEQLELTLNTADIQVSKPTAVPAQTNQPQTWTLAVDGYEVLFRLPNSYDLVRLPAQVDPLAARKQLLQHCILNVSPHDAMDAPLQLPAIVVERVVEHMSHVDPQGNMEIALTCPFCDHGWIAPFDIASFFWAEIQHWALRLLHEVHLMAQAYGWSERDILALSPWRRHHYLNMVNG